MKKTLLTLGLFLTINSLFAQTTITLKPNATDGKDVFSYLGYNQDNINYGNNVQFTAGAWTVSGSYIVQRAFIDFDWSQIPANAVISSASLKLYAWALSSSFGPHSSLSGSNEMIVEKITTQWDENTLTATNIPTTSSANSFVTSQSNSFDQDYTLDVTTLVQDILNDPTNGYGIALRLQTEDYYRRVNFCSSDHTDATKWPEMTITYQVNDVKETLKSTISISNPINNSIHINGFKNSEYKIMDLQGRTISTGNIENNKINSSNLSPSTYFLVVDNETHQLVKL